MPCGRQVDIVVSGHIHSYLRSCPVFNWECVEGRNADNATNSAEPAGVPDLKSRMARDRMEKSTGDEEDEMWRFENDQL